MVLGLQYVAVFGHHEHRDEVDHGQSQELGLLTVLLGTRQTTKQLHDPHPVRGTALATARARERQSMFRGQISVLFNILEQDALPSMLSIMLYRKPNNLGCT